MPGCSELIQNGQSYILVKPLLYCSYYHIKVHMGQRQQARRWGGVGEVKTHEYCHMTKGEDGKWGGVEEGVGRKERGG